MDDISIIVSPTDEIPETDSFIYTPSSFSMDDFSIIISPTDETPETESFTYDPSFASSETSIPSYKTERTINSRKSRYNALPRRKYAGDGLLNGHVSSGVDFQRYLIGHWHLDDYIIVIFQAVSGQRPGGSIPYDDAGPSEPQAAVQNAILIDSEAGAYVRSAAVPHDCMTRFFKISYTFDPRSVGSLAPN